MYVIFTNENVNRKNEAIKLDLVEGESAYIVGIDAERTVDNINGVEPPMEIFK